MSPILKKHMPVILTVIQQCQDEILTKTGVKIQLRPVVIEEPIYNQLKILFESICSCWGDDLESIKGLYGGADVCSKRRILWMVAKLKYPNVTYSSIGKVTDTSHHSSILKGINTGYNLMQVQDPLFMKHFEPVKQFFNVTAEQ